MLVTAVGVLAPLPSELILYKENGKSPRYKETQMNKDISAMENHSPKESHRNTRKVVYHGSKIS